ncbi:aldolase [Mariniphaga sediminis]|uniref:Aldolase n=1 Tax=Mariniphaga sediminis TaxID=1628158 RepID=A0A399D5H5_9BACT|nr:aldolase/citrate lyase family protein [Mariniphaga sediminis]RIH67134.1 aldolase [Mariniphaga sediminis]
MRLLENIRNKKLSIGPFSKSCDSAIIECIGLAGFDFVIIDLEHGPNSMETAQNLVRAATLYQITPIIRVNENNESMISKALDIGAQGVQVPQINNEQSARNVINAARFSPSGNRGVCRYVRAAEYSKKNKNDYFEYSNKNTLIIIQIEGKKGLENIDSILQVEGIDIVFIGPYDLSQSMGVPGQTNHPKVLEAMKMITEKANHYNKIVGTFIETPSDLKIWKDLGLLYLSYKVDVGIFYDACYNIYNELNEV